MNLYAESSAIVSWLLGEAQGEAVREALSEAGQVVTSDIALVECDRVLIRAVALKEATETAAADRRAVLNRAAQHWNVIHLDAEILERARRAFPREPIRTLDALHLSSALAARRAVAGLKLLALDRRIRENGEELGFDLLP